MDSITQATLGAAIGEALLGKKVIWVHAVSVGEVLQLQTIIQGIRQKRSDVEFVIAEGLEHFNPCSYVPYVKEAANWLETTVWK